MADTGDVDVAAIRSVLLEVIDGLSREYSHLQASSVLQKAVGRLANRRDLQTEQALLASFYDLFRTGYLSWGHDLANPAPPFCHVTCWDAGLSLSTAETPPILMAIFFISSTAAPSALSLLRTLLRP